MDIKTPEELHNIIHEVEIHSSFYECLTEVSGTDIPILSSKIAKENQVPKDLISKITSIEKNLAKLFLDENDVLRKDVVRYFKENNYKVHTLRNVRKVKYQHEIVVPDYISPEEDTFKLLF